MYYYRSPEHSHHSVLSFAFAFDAEEDGEKYHFALGYPYSYSRCMSMIQRLKRDRGDILKVEAVAKSVVSGKRRQLEFVVVVVVVRTKG